MFEVGQVYKDGYGIKYFVVEYNVVYIDNKRRDKIMLVISNNKLPPTVHNIAQMFYSLQVYTKEGKWVGYARDFLSYHATKEYRKELYTRKHNPKMDLVPN